MRGIYAFSVALAIALVLVMAFRAWYSDSLFASRTVASYVSAQHSAFLRHDVEYTLRQAIAFANECYVASGLSDGSCYSRYLSAWASDWASEGVILSDVNVTPIIDGNHLVSALAKPVRYSGVIRGSIPAGFGVISRIGG